MLHVDRFLFWFSLHCFNKKNVPDQLKFKKCIHLEPLVIWLKMSWGDLCMLHSTIPPPNANHLYFLKFIWWQVQWVWNVLLSCPRMRQTIQLVHLLFISAHKLVWLVTICLSSREIFKLSKTCIPVFQEWFLSCTVIA